jgi:hypothetical protein
MVGAVEMSSFPVLCLHQGPTGMLISHGSSGLDVSLASILSDFARNN